MGCILLETNSPEATGDFSKAMAITTTTTMAASIDMRPRLHHRVTASLDSFLILGSVSEGTDCTCGKEAAVGMHNKCLLCVSVSCKHEEMNCQCQRQGGKHIRRVSAPLVVLQPTDLLEPHILSFNTSSKLGPVSDCGAVHPASPASPPPASLVHSPLVVTNHAHYQKKAERHVKFSTFQVREHDIMIDDTLSSSPLVVSDGLLMTLDWSFHDNPSVTLPSLDTNEQSSRRSTTSKGASPSRPTAALTPRTKKQRWEKLRDGGRYTDRDLWRADRKRQILERNAFFGKTCAIYGHEDDGHAS